MRIDLLPGWYDDWALVERERVRQRLLHALEALSCQLARAGRCAEAVEAAMMAVTAEPLRESAQRVLIQAHLAEGNWVEGRRTFEAYRDVLDRELGVQPDPELAAMAPSARPAPARRALRCPCITLPTHLPEQIGRPSAAGRSSTVARSRSPAGVPVGDEVTQLVRRMNTQLVVQDPPAALKLPPGFADVALCEVHPDDKAVSALAQLLHLQGTRCKL